MEKLKRSEFLFLYDVKWGNPNGDPNDENKPRYDEITSHVLVSDVRLKRTVRDYLEQNGKTIFISKSTDVQTSEGRTKALIGDSKDPLNDILNKAIDIRLFGGMLPIKLAKKGSSGDSITLIGPIQIRMGESLHAVDLSYIKGTAAFASRENAQMSSFREEYLVPYALIAFYGVINQNAAVNTKLTEDDVEEFFKALWFGTKDLITRSKMEQLPRLLVQIEYNDDTHNGGLDAFISLKTEKSENEIRSILDYTLDLTKLFDLIKRNAKRIPRVRYLSSDELKITPTFENLEGVNVEKFKMEA
ncbi:type I-B CRISPR-associated protein Cas7/Csh2 [Athalassotoga sp.]|uniref:type I-B CRISPR-associated protein Cas7/Csh2 n=1 Tax=Athalassotoga sp. TaxID=2022597 RepID=UPI003D0353DB